jgi:hypothetical protein
VSICDNTTGNLVLNCGFETGDFTGWALTGNVGYTGVTGSYANSGNFGAYFGAVGSDGYLSQTLLTTVAGTVNLSFYVENTGDPANDFTVFWNGTDVGPDLVNVGIFSYTQYSYLLTSVGSDTLQFNIRQDPRVWGLDDIVVTQLTGSIPEPGTIGMLFGGLGLIVAGLRRRRA